MGLYKLLLKIGSTGSIARWVVKQYKKIKSNNIDLDDDAIVEMIIMSRYSAFPPKDDERKRLNEVLEGKLVSAIGFDPYDYETRSELFSLLHGLSMTIIYIEMNIRWPEDDHIYDKCYDVVSEELNRMGIK